MDKAEQRKPPSWVETAKRLAPAVLGATVGAGVVKILRPGVRRTQARNRRLAISLDDIQRSQAVQFTNRPWDWDHARTATMATPSGRHRLPQMNTVRSEFNYEL